MIAKASAKKSPKDKPSAARPGRGASFNARGESVVRPPIGGTARAPGGASRQNKAPPTIRVLLAKVGLDGHDRGVKIVARCLRDAGMDVIYSGLHRTPEEVTSAAIQEDVDVLGVSLLSGAHMTIIPRIFKLLKAGKADDILVLAGGVMSDADAARLKKMGVGDVLLQDTPPQAIVETVRRLCASKPR